VLKVLLDKILKSDKINSEKKFAPTLSEGFFFFRGLRSPQPLKARGFRPSRGTAEALP
jgi:hypothetical protein